MGQPSDQGDYVTVTGFRVWWTPKHPSEIHLTSNDPDFTHPDTQDGLRVMFSSNPRSANYHPANFNRCRDILMKYEKSAPAEAATEADRRLDKRDL